MRYLLVTAMLVFSLGFAGADDFGSREVRSVIRASAEANRPVFLTDSHVVDNSNILGPTKELLPPFMATQLLGKRDYFEWCLRWNTAQYALASERAVPPRTVSGWIASRSGFARSMTAGGFFGRSRRGSHHSTTRSREQAWHIGGYGGGPVTIYNPFVSPTAAAPRKRAR